MTFETCGPTGSRLTFPVRKPKRVGVRVETVSFRVRQLLRSSDFRNSDRVYGWAHRDVGEDRALGGWRKDERT